MEHRLSSIPIYFTDDYDLFAIATGNRQIKPGKIKKLRKVVEDGLNLFAYFPILVSEQKGKLKIEDGQHRYTVCRLLGLPIFYTLYKGELSLVSVARLNSASDKWNNMDFIRCFIETGNLQYKEFHDFILQHRISVSTAIGLLTKGYDYTGGFSNDKIIDSFYSGTFVIKKMDEAVHIVKEADHFHMFTFNHHRGFLEATAVVIRERPYKMKDVYNAWLGKYGKMVIKPTGKEFLSLFDQLIQNKKYDKKFAA